MKIPMDEVSTELMERGAAAFASLQRTELPPGWRVNRDFGVYDNAACFDCYGGPLRGTRVIQEVCFVDAGDGSPPQLWIHVSASKHGGTKTGAPSARLPSWYEMTAVKDIFVGAERKAIMVFAPASEHFSEFEVLHLWHCWDKPELIPDLRHPTGKL